MTETALTLYVDLDQGSRISLEAAATASLAWASLIKSINHHVDPLSEWRVELESAIPGSQRIRSIIKLPDSAHARGVVQGAILASLIFIAKETVAWGVGEIMEYLSGPDAPEEVQKLSDTERNEIAETVVNKLRAGVGRKEATKVYEALKVDENVRGAGATASLTNRPSIVIPRDEFPSVAEVVEEEPKSERTTREQAELTLIRPILANDTSRRWGFLSRHGTFGASIRDQVFLDALAAGELNVPMAQGIRMLVEVEITEKFDGTVWMPVDRIITRVIEIIPPPRQVRLDLEGPQ
ncbi:MAG: hypothetical protein WD969_16055 [Paracoccaceae bacterium]